MRLLSAAAFAIALTACASETPRPVVIKPEAPNPDFVPDNASPHWLELWKQHLEFVYPGYIIGHPLMGDMYCIMTDVDELFMQCGLSPLPAQILCWLEERERGEGENFRCTDWPPGSLGLSGKET